MSVRRHLVAWHRDLGYLACGLTVAYAVSGVAVNHEEHWDYNRATRREARTIGAPAVILPGLTEQRRRELDAAPTAVADAELPALIDAVTARVGRPAPPHNAFFRGPDAMHLYYASGDSDEVVYHPRSGRAELIRRRDRWLLRDLNYLHLNEGRGLWTYVADAYAVVLATLALTGIFIARGRRGLRGRGGLLLALGLVVPLVALLVLRHR
ncbi:MAG TPA: PepSY-associated TM helix domain-containing protein [Polyangiaceae bacterium]|nr:PepSY-associated TM helix domain-containing protein [Polyangiaceae bacterium]